jgi:hypothetical protein
MVPKFQVATACFSCSPLDLNSSKFTPLLWMLLNYLLNLPNYNFNIHQWANKNSAVSVVKLSLLITITSSLLCFPYQKDERALPGNLLTIRCSPPPRNKMSLTSPPTFSLCFYSFAILPHSLASLQRLDVVLYSTPFYFWLLESKRPKRKE